MKKLIIAAVIAITSTVSIAPLAQAASVTINTDDRRGPPPRYVQDHQRPHQRPHHRRDNDCTVRKVKTYRHGAVIVKETRVCR